MNSEYQTPPPHPDPLKWSHVRIQRGDRGSAPPPGKSKVLWVSRICIWTPSPRPWNRLDPPPRNLVKKRQKPLTELIFGSRAWTTLAKIHGSAHGSASIQTTRATIGLPAKCHSDGVSVAGR